MSKMSPAQKAANKASQKVRDRAYAARKRAYREAREAAEKSAEESAFAQQRDKADRALDKERLNRNEAISAIEREIATLHEKLTRTKEQYEMSMEPKLKARKDAQSAFQAHRDALFDGVDALFPDVKSCWSVSQWAIPAETRAQMDSAAASTEVMS